MRQVEIFIISSEVHTHNIDPYIVAKWKTSTNYSNFIYFLKK